MKYFGGLSTQEIAEAMGTSVRSIERRWNFAKANLFRLIRNET